MRRKTLYSYLFKETISYFLVSLFAFTAVLVTLNIVRLSSLILNKGVLFTDVLTVFATLIPTFLEIALPLSALLGTMSAFARFSGDSELVVIRASGISLTELVWPILTFALLTLLMGVFVCFYARPWGFSKLQETLFSIAQTRTTAGLEEGAFTKLGNLTLYTTTVDPNAGTFTNVLVDDRRNSEERQITFAKTGAIASDPTTYKISLLLRDGTTHGVIGNKYTVTAFRTNVISIDPQELYSDDEQKKGKQVGAMTLDELSLTKKEYESIRDKFNRGEIITKALPLTLSLGQRIEEGQLNERELKKRINRASVEYGRRFAMPFASFILSFMGMALGVQPPRTQKSWGIGLSIIFGLVVFVLYYALLSVGIALSEGGLLSPYIVLWIPNVTFAVIAAILIYNIGKERWHSVAEAVIDRWISIKALCIR